MQTKLERIGDKVTRYTGSNFTVVNVSSATSKYSQWPQSSQRDYVSVSVYWSIGLLPDKQNCGLRMRRECQERFPHHRGLAIPTCITAREWRTCRDACRDRLLISGFLWSRWRGKCSRHPRRMRNPQFYVSGKRPMAYLKSRSSRIQVGIWTLVLTTGGVGSCYVGGHTAVLKVDVLGKIGWSFIKGMLLRFAK